MWGRQLVAFYSWKQYQLFLFEGEDGHESQFQLDWLLKAAVFQPSEDVTPIPWDTKSVQPAVSTFQYDEVIKDQDGTKKIMKSMLVHGFAFVNGLPPTTVEGTKVAAELIAAPSRVGPDYGTVGDTWEITSDHIDRLSDLAYTNLGLSPHNDGTYCNLPPGYREACFVPCLGSHFSYT